jgi:hypothetical protein
MLLLLLLLLLLMRGLFVLQAAASPADTLSGVV